MNGVEGKIVNIDLNTGRWHVNVETEGGEGAAESDGAAEEAEGPAAATAVTTYKLKTANLELVPNGVERQGERLGISRPHLYDSYSSQNASTP